MIEKCLDDSPLQGACCTNACPHRGSCIAPRIPLLIYSVVLNRREGKLSADSYLNDLAGGMA